MVMNLRSELLQCGMVMTHALTRSALGWLFVAALAACSAPEPAEPRWNDGPEGAWFRGDFHVHTSVGSNDTRLKDGTYESWPAAVKEIARARGMDFVVITDHSNSAGSATTTTREDGRLWNRGPEFPVWETAAALSDAMFLMIDGAELSPVSTLNAAECDFCSSPGTGELTPVGHVGCVPEDLTGFDRTVNFVDRPPGQVSGGSSVEQCHAAGGWAVVNHPFPKVSPWIEYDWTSYDYDAIEVWNGGVAYDMSDTAAFDAYLCDRLAGRAVVAVGGSDNHRTRLDYRTGNGVNLDPPLGLPMTTVFAATFEWSAIMAGLHAGRVVVHDSETFVEFRIYKDGAYRGTIGDTLAATDGATVWLKGESRVAQDLQLWHVAPGACSDRRAAGADLEPSVAKTSIAKLRVAGAFSARRDVRLKAGLYYATLGDASTGKINVRDVALTNVLTVAP